MTAARAVGVRFAERGKTTGGTDGDMLSVALHLRGAGLPLVKPWCPVQRHLRICPWKS